ncbi:MAG: NFACT family protein [Acidobacteriota bacterium]
MLSMLELRRVTRIVKSSLPGCRVKRIVPFGGTSVVLHCMDDAKNRTNILLSCDRQYARICTVDTVEAPGSSTGSFCEFLHAHITGAVISGLDLAPGNRQLCFGLKTRSDEWKLYLSILGVRSNLYLIDDRKRVVHCMRPLEETRRDLEIGALWQDPEGSVPSEGVDRWAEVPDNVYLATIGKDYARLELHRDIEVLARAISGVIAKERNLLGRKLNRLEADLADTRLAEFEREKGELLKTVLHKIKPGDDSVTVLDYSSGKTVAISIDPLKSPAANLEAYFNRYQKGSRGAQIIRQQIWRLESLRNDLDHIEDRMREALEKDPPEKEALDAIRSQPLVRPLIGRYAPKSGRKTLEQKLKVEDKIPKRLQPKRYRTEDGLEIWVGRNDEGNDYLTTRMARGNDLFFHLEGYPGSHVILRTDGRSDPPAGSVLDACELAVHFSKMKNAGRADVHIAPVKNIKKPKGAKPGLVYVRQSKTVHLRRNPSRLENILASRTDG